MAFSEKIGEIPAAALAGSPPSTQDFISLGIYVGMALFVVAFLLFLAAVPGRKTRSTIKDQPYESGIFPTRPAKLREPVPFYLVAIFFVIFDVEVIFIASWAVAYDLLGWAGFINVTVFILILFLGLVHLWRVGGLDWGGSSPRWKKAGRKSDE